MTRRRLFRLKAAALLVPVGVSCLLPEFGGRLGRLLNDTAGDTRRLQGGWLADWSEPGRPPVWIEIDGDTLTFHNPLHGQPDNHESYRFVVNSWAKPGRLRLTTWLGPGTPQPGHKPPLSYRYTVDGDQLVLGNRWAERGESPKLSYRRRPDLTKPNR